MMRVNFPPTWVRCPCDGGNLVQGNGDWECRACHLRFPHLDGIPCVVAEPARLLARWQEQLTTFSHANKRAQAEILAELADSDAHPLTQRRLQNLQEGYERHRAAVLRLMQAAGLEPLGEPVVTEPAHPGGSLLSYWPHVHRDWGWEQAGSRENAAALAACLEVLPKGASTSLGRTLVLGAGACRLTYDLQRSTSAPLMVALDLHPVGLMVARRIIAGERLRMYDIPGHPETIAHMVVERTLCAPDPGVAGFFPIVADGLAPPIAANSFDTVVTPWFIDQVPRDLAELLPVIRRVLTPNGRWLNHGPLLYRPSHTAWRHRYRREEVLALVDEAGFELEAHTSRRMLYLECPEDTQGRTETILTFSARRRVHTKQADIPSSPAWLDDPDVPIPVFAEFSEFEAPHPMFAVVARLIDGHRSATDIARFLIANHNVPAHAAVGGVTAAVREIFRRYRGTTS